MTDYYAVLQVAPRADPEVIEAAYRRLARKWHPDTNADPEAPARIRELNEAYEVLSDSARRRAYDATRILGGLADGLGAGSGIRSWLPVAGAAMVGLLLLPRLGRLALPLLVLGVGLYWWRRAKRP